MRLFIRVVFPLPVPPAIPMTKTSMACSSIRCRSVRSLVYYSEKTEKREPFLKIKFWRPRKGGLAGYMVQAFGEPMTNAAALRCRMLHLDKGLFLNYNEHCSVWGGIL